MHNALQTDTIQLTPLREHHAAVFAEALGDSGDEISQWLGEQSAPKSVDAIEAFIAGWEQGWRAQTKYGLLVTELADNRCVGFGFLNHINHQHRFANLGYWIRPDAAGQGYATAVTRLLAEFGFATLNLVRLELVIEPGNRASQRVAEKAGSVKEGLLHNRLCVNGEVRDALMYSLISPYT